CHQALVVGGEVHTPDQAGAALESKCLLATLGVPQLDLPPDLQRYDAFAVSVNHQAEGDSESPLAVELWLSCLRVPHMHSPVGARPQDTLALRAKFHVSGRVGQPSPEEGLAKRFLAALRVPQAHSVYAGRDDAFAVGRKGHAGNRTGVSLEGDVAVLELV